MLVKDLKAGDRVCLSEPDGVAVITDKQRSRLFQAAGGCWRLDMKVVEGPHVGKRISDQHHPGEEEIEVPRS